MSLYQNCIALWCQCKENKRICTSIFIFLCPWCNQQFSLAFCFCRILLTLDKLITVTCDDPWGFINQFPQQPSTHLWYRFSVLFLQMAVSDLHSESFHVCKLQIFFPWVYAMYLGINVSTWRGRSLRSLLWSSQWLSGLSTALCLCSKEGKCLICVWIAHEDR